MALIINGLFLEVDSVQDADPFYCCLINCIAGMDDMLACGDPACCCASDGK